VEFNNREGEFGFMLEVKILEELGLVIGDPILASLLTWDIVESPKVVDDPKIKILISSKQVFRVCLEVP
jgi:hypothetical protein